MKDIAICGKDMRFCRMLELELQAMGYTVARNPRGGSFRLWIADLDTVSPTAGHHPERDYWGITRDDTALTEEQRNACLRVLNRPLSMESFRREIALHLSHEDTAAHPTAPCPRLHRTSFGFELDGEPLSLTDTEIRILQALYDRRGETVPRTQLCALLGNETNDKLADVYICLLRKKLEANGSPRLLFTVRGIGYRLVDEAAQ